MNHRQKVRNQGLSEQTKDNACAEVTSRDRITPVMGGNKEQNENRDI